MMTQVQEKRKREKEERDYLISYYYTNALHRPYHWCIVMAADFKRDTQMAPKSLHLKKKKKIFENCYLLFDFLPSNLTDDGIN
jgi:hypothetical protein